MQPEEGKGMSFDFGEVEQCEEEDGLLVISYRIPEAKRVVEVYSLVGTSWVEAYRTTEKYDFELTAVDIYLGDYAAIGYPVAFIGYRIDGTGQYLDLDIVQAEAGGRDVRDQHAVPKPRLRQWRLERRRRHALPNRHRPHIRLRLPTAALG